MPPRGSAVHSLADLRRAQPVDGALRNLIGILAGKLDLFASLPVFEYEAAVEGNETFAAAFHRLAEHERRSFDDLLECLRVHLNETTAALGEADADDAASGTAACG